MRTPFVVVAVAWGGLALAQNVSDLMPAPPPAPAGTSGVYYPGMPVPPTVLQEAQPPSGKGAPERTGLVLPDENYGGSDEVEPDVAVDTSNGTHTVRRGDTLWGLSATYFHNPWYWPKLWAFNPSITNPHWIYPGDIIRLSNGGAVEVKPPPSESEPGQAKLTGRPMPAPSLFRQNGFVEPGELEMAGTIIGSKEEKIMLSTLDEAYVRYSPKQPLVVGEKYSVYKPMRTVNHPVTGKRLGEIIEILGEAVVESVTDGHIARMLITNAIDPMERGYRVGPLRHPFHLVDPKAASRDLDGVVVATIQPIELVGADILVFVDRGEKEGVQMGNRFSVVRRGDGYQPLLWHGAPIDDKRFPREVIGQLQVVDLRNGLSTGWMLRSAKEVRIGDRVELHRGE